MRIGIDIGGTFTDIVIYSPETNQITTFKVLSTPQHPEQAFLTGVKRIGAGIRQIIHGSTVATNALLERKGARTALIATKGFKDVIEIGRQNRSSLYELNPSKPMPLVPAELRFEVPERINHLGEVQQALEESSIREVLEQIKTLRIDSIAVSLLFSFLHPQHEKSIKKIFEQSGYPVSISSEILPEFREYERSSTTVVNAYVSPIMDRYLENIQQAIPEIPLQIMQSNGGCINPETARQSAVRCILSGPAGGAVGAKQVAEMAGIHKIITFDMGGTSTDVGLSDGEIQVSTDSSIDGLPIHIPMIKIHTVGSGGGSIAYKDSGAALRVGPQSAGADPGPACYGKGDLPTVTDANLILGRLSAEHFLGGEMQLDPQRAIDAVEKLGASLGLDVYETASGIVEIANTHMERALRVISIERGYDPQDFTLVSFGGAGGLHAAELARGLGIRQVLVPLHASTLSALGMIMADVIKDYSRTIMAPFGQHEVTALSIEQELKQQAVLDLQAEGFGIEDIQMQTSFDIRYKGQSFELTIPQSERLGADFHAMHETMYGYKEEGAELEVVNIRLRAAGITQKPALVAEPSTGPSPSDAILKTGNIYLDNRECEVTFYDSEKLKPGNIIPGPAIVIRKDTTILIGEKDRATVDPHLNILINIGATHA